MTFGEKLTNSYNSLENDTNPYKIYPRGNSLVHISNMITEITYQQYICGYHLYII